MCSLFHSRATRPANGKRASLRRRLAVAAPLFFVGLALAEPEENIMTIMLNTPDARDYQTLEPAILPIGHPAAPALDPGPAAASPDYRARFANSERNGRVDVTLPKGEWALAWEHEIRKGTLPQAVLSTADRVLVQTGVWQLFDPEGQLLKEGSAGPSTVALDPEHRRFYHMNRTGDIVARGLSEGEQIFAAMPFLGSEFSRPLIRCYGQQLLLIGVERQLDPHGNQKASRSLLEWIDLGDPLDVSGTGLLLSAQNSGTLIFPTTAFLAAAGEAGLVCASPGRIYISTRAERLDAVYGGEFAPTSLSLGGNGVAYLAVREGEESYLWRLGLDGKLLQSIAMPEGLGPLIAPPIIGPGSQIFLAASNRIAGLNPQGALLWAWNAPTPLAGATCTADGTLVVVTQRELGLLSPAGEYQRLHRNVDSRFYTPPCVTRDGLIVLATKQHVQAYRAAH